MSDLLNREPIYSHEQIVMNSGEAPSNHEEEDEEALYIAYIVVITTMIIYVVVGTWMEKKKCGFGHETGVVILIGLGIGGLVHLGGDKVSTEFNPVVLFDFGLPFILYSAGYNMRRRRFFDDINNITMFGILSTVVCFIVLSLTTVFIFSQEWVTRLSDGSVV